MPVSNAMYFSWPVEKNGNNWSRKTRKGDLTCRVAQRPLSAETRARGTANYRPKADSSVHCLRCVGNGCQPADIAVFPRDTLGW